jgi:hypothetical protein
MREDGEIDAEIRSFCMARVEGRHGQGRGTTPITDCRSRPPCGPDLPSSCCMACQLLEMTWAHFQHAFASVEAMIALAALEIGTPELLFELAQAAERWAAKCCRRQRLLWVNALRSQVLQNCSWRRSMGPL